MSQVSWSKSDDKPGRVEDQPEAPAGQVTDDSYVTGKERDAGPVPVIGDDDPVEAPVQPTKSDSDEALERDEREATDKSNIIKGPREKPPPGSLREPDDKDLGLTEE
ncbi:hypothetical protein FocnCong_v021076 [Fusarium oxysporum f. sp. conglutinans]|nr:hypothetical protein FocnCong_v021076 [Fusarium oxysporum f. sp. conglutinans]